MNYSTAQAWQAFNELAVDSVLIPLDLSAGSVSEAAVFEAYQALATLLADVNTEEQHLYVVEVVEPNTASTAGEILVYYQIASGYDKFNNPPNNNYPPDYLAWWSSQYAAAQCPTTNRANTVIQQRINAANLIALNPDQFFHSVETWTVTNDQTWLPARNYWWKDPFMASPTPNNGDYRETLLISWVPGSQQGSLCLNSAEMTYWTGNSTVGTWRAIMKIRNQHCPTKIFSSYRLVTGGQQVFPPAPPVPFTWFHGGQFTYGLIGGGSNSYAMRAFVVVVALGAFLCAQAQLIWMQTFSQPEKATVWDIALDASGDLMASLYPFETSVGMGSNSTIVRLSALDGTMLNEGSLALAGHSTFAAKLLPHGPSNGWLVIASIAPEPFGPLDSVRVGTILLNSTLTQLTHSIVGMAGRYVSYTQALAHPDGTIRIAYQTFDESFQSQFKGLTTDIDGNELQSLELHSVASFPSIGSLSLLPNGNMLMASTSAFWDPVTNTSGAIQEYSDTWTELSRHGLPMVDPSTQLSQNSPQWPSHAIVLPSGNIIVSSYYWKCFCDDQRTVVQKLAPTGSLLLQWTTESQFVRDLPATIRSIDRSGEFIYVARMNNWLVEGFSGNSPSQVEIFKMDTSLNVLGSYVLDGLEDNTYYYPTFLSAGQDGSVYIAGSLRTLNLPGAQPQGWVAKIGADSFVSVNERSKPSANLYPNPGAEGFQLVLGEPVTNGRLELFDMQGKLVHVEAFQGANGQITIPGLPAGMYCVTLRDASGATMLQQRWVKQ